MFGNKGVYVNSVGKLQDEVDRSSTDEQLQGTREGHITHAGRPAETICSVMPLV